MKKGIKFFFLMFIFWGERLGEGQRERVREDPKEALGRETEREIPKQPEVGLKFTNREIMT